MATPALPSTTRRMPRGLLIAGGMLLLAVLIICGVWAVMASSAANRWQVAEAKLKAAGETLDLLTIAPKPVPDEDNFCALEPLKDIALVVGDDPKSGEPGERRTRLQELMVASELNNFEPSGVNHGIRWRAQAWAEMNRPPVVSPGGRKRPKAKGSGRPLKYLPMPSASGNPGRDLLTGMAEGDALLVELHDGLNRPLSFLTPAIQNRHVLAALELRYPHSHPLQPLVNWLAVHAQASVVAGEWQAAADDVRVMLRLAEALGHEPSLKCSSEAMEVFAQALEPAWSLLNSGQASEVQVQNLLRDLTRIDFQAILLLALRGTLAADTRELDEMVSGDGPVSTLLNIDVGLRTAGKAQRMAAGLQTTALFRLNLPAVMQGNKAAQVTHMLDVHLAPLQHAGVKGLREEMDRFNYSWMAASTSTSVFDLYPPAFSGRFYRLYDAAVLAQVRLDQARIACALELYYAKYQSYPSALKELVPDFLPAVPADITDGNQMRFELTYGGRYKLWSLGWDGDDDGGKVIVTRREIPEAPRLEQRDYPGDWVWTYDPLVPAAPRSKK